MSYHISLAFKNIHIVDSMYFLSVSALGILITLWIDISHIYQTRAHTNIPSCRLVRTVKLSSSLVCGTK